jgi:hypothetical protein
VVSHAKCGVLAEFRDGLKYLAVSKKKLEWATLKA